MILAMTLAGSEILYWCYAAGPALARGARTVDPGAACRLAASASCSALRHRASAASRVYGATLLLTWPTGRADGRVLSRRRRSRPVAASRPCRSSSCRRGEPQLRLWPAPDGGRRLDAPRRAVVAGLAAAGFAIGTSLEDDTRCSGARRGGGRNVAGRWSPSSCCGRSERGRARGRRRGARRRRPARPHAVRRRRGRPRRAGAVAGWRSTTRLDDWPSRGRPGARRPRCRDHAPRRAAGPGSRRRKVAIAAAYEPVLRRLTASSSPSSPSSACSRYGTSTC